MTNAIQMLADMGRSAAWSQMTADQYAAAIAALDTDPALAGALLDRDTAAISRALGGRATMVCMVAPAEEEEQPAQGEEPAQEPAKDS